MRGSPAMIRYSDFLDQLDADNIASVTFAGTQIDGHFKHPVAGTRAANDASPTVFRSRVPDFGDPTLLPELREERVAFGVASSQWLGIGATTIIGVLVAFLLAKPMLLIIAAAFFAGLVRVARGGKFDIHSILSMVPMFRSVSGQSADEKKSAGDSPRDGN